MAVSSVYSPAQCDMRPERITVQRSAMTIKQLLLDWSKTRVREYKASPTDIYVFRSLSAMVYRNT